MLEGIIKNKALEVGFDLVGFASAEDPLLAEAATRYMSWLRDNNNATMDYLKRHAEIKTRPEKFFSNVRSIVCVGTLYGAVVPTDQKGMRPEVSIYTRGQDYHAVMTDRLTALAQWLEREHNVQARVFVDAQPVFERFWAWRAGLGWIGKNAVLINRTLGSYFFLGGLFVDAKLQEDAPAPDHCGRCTKCVDACPTNAILDQRAIDARKCIAYHTIENRGAVLPEVMEKTGRWIAGCDICQIVCPWNDPVVQGSTFTQSNPVFTATLQELSLWSETQFKTATRDTAMARMKYSAFVRNLAIAIVHSSLALEQKHNALDALKKSSHTISEAGPHANEAKSAVSSTIAWAQNQLGGSDDAT